jgi:ketosteroid isomerase-like protein
MAEPRRTDAHLSPAEVVEQWQERAWGRCDLDAVDDLIAEPFVRHNRDGTAKRTRAELKADLREYQKALGRPVIEVRDRVVDGNTVWSRTTMRGANLHTGEPRVVDWIHVHRIVDGRIAEVWTLHAVDAEWEA